MRLLAIKELDSKAKRRCASRPGHHPQQGLKAVRQRAQPHPKPLTFVKRSFRAWLECVTTRVRWPGQLWYRMCIICTAVSVLPVPAHTGTHALVRQAGNEWLFCLRHQPSTLPTDQLPSHIQAHFKQSESNQPPSCNAQQSAPHQLLTNTRTHQHTWRAHHHCQPWLHTRHDCLGLHRREPHCVLRR